MSRKENFKPFERFIGNLEDINSLEGIAKSLASLETLNNLIHQRALYIETFPLKRLNEFMILGYIYLKDDGTVSFLAKEAVPKLIGTFDVLTFEDFRTQNLDASYEYYFSDEFAIPTSGTICACCNEKITITDLKTRPCIKQEDKYYHLKCEYNEYMRIVKKTYDNALKQVYDFNFSSKVLNDSKAPEYKKHRVFTMQAITPDGTIVMYLSSRMITIAFGDSFKEINFKFLKQKFDFIYHTKSEPFNPRTIRLGEKDYTKLPELFEAIKRC